MARDVTEFNGPTWVYHALCEHGGSLYVGIARDVPRRISQHRRDKPWWDRDVWAVSAARFPTRTIAAEVEMESIRLLNPHWNRIGRLLLPHEEPHGRMAIEPIEETSFGPTGVNSWDLLRQSLAGDH